MSSLLVTTGATVTFKPLVKYVLSSSFIRGIIDLNVSNLYVQYGNEIREGTNISSEFCENCLTEELLNEFELELQMNKDNFKTYISNKYSFKLKCFPFSRNINDFIEKSEIVVSHAGTGSIIDTLKLQKPLIVVTNSELMDNHQDDIANEFVSLNYCVKLTCNDLKSPKLLTCINKILQKEVKFDILEDQNTLYLANIIYSELNGL